MADVVRVPGQPVAHVPGCTHIDGSPTEPVNAEAAPLRPCYTCMVSKDHDYVDRFYDARGRKRLRRSA